MEKENFSQNCTLECLQISVENMEEMENVDPTIDGFLSVSRADNIEEEQVESSTENVEELLKIVPEENNEMLQQLLHIKSKIQIEKKVHYDMEKESLLFMKEQLELCNIDFNNEIATLHKDAYSLSNQDQQLNLQFKNTEIVNMKTLLNLLKLHCNKDNGDLQKQSDNLSKLQERCANINTQFINCKAINLQRIEAKKQCELMENNYVEALNMYEEKQKVFQNIIYQSNSDLNKVKDKLNEKSAVFQIAQGKCEESSKAFDSQSKEVEETTLELQQLKARIANLQTEMAFFESQSKLTLEKMNNDIKAKQKCLEKIVASETQLNDEIKLIQDEHKELNLNKESVSEQKQALKLKLDALTQVELELRNQLMLCETVHAEKFQKKSDDIISIGNKLYQLEKKREKLDKLLERTNEQIELVNNNINSILTKRHSIDIKQVELEEERNDLNAASALRKINHQSLIISVKREQSNLISKKSELELKSALRVNRSLDKEKILQELKNDDKFQVEQLDYQNLVKEYEEKIIDATKKFDEKFNLAISRQNEINDEMIIQNNKKSTLLILLEKEKIARDKLFSNYQKLQEESGNLNKETKRRVVGILKSPHKSPSLASKNVTFRNKVSIENVSQSTVDTFIDDFLHRTRDSQIPNKDETPAVPSSANKPSTSKLNDPFDFLLQQASTSKTTKPLMRRHYNPFDAPEKDE